MNIKSNISSILSSIPSNVHLVAVVKSATLNQIQEALKSGVTDLAFSSYQQLAALNKLILKDFRRHFIGHIQTNKVKKIILERPSLIQSVDSYKIAKKLNEACEELHLQQDILLQIKTDEDKEHGFNPDELREVIFKVEAELKNLNLKGIMTIPPSGDKTNLSEVFKETKILFDQSERYLGRKLDYLSMGMSEDYKIAVENGSNMVRIGRAIFS